MVIRTPKELAAVVRERRKRLGWSQQDLADHVGVGRQWVSDFERGKPTAHLNCVLSTLNALQIPLSVDLSPREVAVSDEVINLDELLGT